MNIHKKIGSNPQFVTYLSVVFLCNFFKIKITNFSMKTFNCSLLFNFLHLHIFIQSNLMLFHVLRVILPLIMTVNSFLRVPMTSRALDSCNFANFGLIMVIISVFSSFFVSSSSFSPNSASQSALK